MPVSHMTDTLARRALHGTLVASALLLLPHAAAAQRRALSFDVTVGQGHGFTSDEYQNDRRGGTLDLLLGLRLRPARAGALVAAITTGIQGPFMSSDICYLSPRGGCIAKLPSTTTTGVLAGWENSNATLRALAGPAYVHGRGAGAVAMHGRLDGALPVARHVALVGSVRGTLVPSFHGATLGLAGAGVGIRIR